ncbi:hypothetical protein F66182_11096 [Fusarium sp. NRRL 66182]|nr:hypothetical protein F66182_11096 [Fusarium sp. NRRL 66182]
MPGSDPCPFCGFKPDQGGYELLLHIENHHPDAGQSPFAVAEDPVPCPEEGCGEFVSPDELAYHLELHELEAQDMAPGEDEPAPEQVPSVPRKPEYPSRGSSRKHNKVSAIQAWKDLFIGNGSKSSNSRDSSSSSSRTRHKIKREEAGVSKRHSSSPNRDGERSKHSARLGKSELGRFAHERKMPSWLVDLLKEEGQVCNDGKPTLGSLSPSSTDSMCLGLLPVLSQLLEQSPSTQYAYLCHPQVQHVSKLRREGEHPRSRREEQTPLLAKT